MKRSTYILPTLLFLFGSCFTTLNVKEIQNLEKIEFGSLQLKPEIEPNELRFDIIRQTYSKTINDSTLESKLTPYHPLGFYLGNGLFFDLNKNLSIRIDYLLNLSGCEPFEIKQLYSLNKDKSAILYKFNNNSFSINYNPRKKDYVKYTKVVLGDSIAFTARNRLSYAIVKSDTSILYRGEKRIWDVINQRDSSNFYIEYGRRKQNYILEGNRIILDDYYIITLNNDNNIIEIKTATKNGENTLYTIIRDNNNLFIFNHKYYGYKLEIANNTLIVNLGDKFATKYELH
jgi:hypothetical protein